MDKRIRDNFEQAIDILANKVTHKEFDMRQWRADDKGSVEFYAVHECGTIGCALGQLPVKGTGELAPIKSDSVGSFKALSWGKYQDRIFGHLSKSADAFLFSGVWADYDNTPEGAAKRMEYYLNNQEKINCDDWEYSSFEAGWAD